MQAIYAILALAFLSSICDAQEFSYNGQHGPEHWGEAYKRCSGKYQSPININLLNVFETEFPPFFMENFEVVPKKVKVVNNGHTVLLRFTYEPEEKPLVRGGPFGSLKPIYEVEQFHFHWGANDSVGSEDLINNSSYPAELHLVLRNQKFENFESALGQIDGVAVMAFFFKIGNDDNMKYSQLVSLLDLIPRSNMSTEFDKPQPLNDFLTSNYMQFFTYTGSLTTPPCSEHVTWIDFEEAIPISEYQLIQFRKLSAADDHPLSNNFRPIQPLNNRPVYRASLPVFDNGIKLPISSIPFVDAANGVSSNKIMFILLWICFTLQLIM